MLFPVKNSSEKLFFKACKCDYVQPLLQTPLVTSPCQNRLQSVKCQLLVWFISYLCDLTVYTPSRQFCSADTWTPCIPILTLKPLADTFSLTVLQSNDILSLLTHIKSSHAFKTVFKTHPHPPHYVLVHVCECVCVCVQDYFFIFMYTFCQSCKVQC